MWRRVARAAAGRGEAGCPLSTISTLGGLAPQGCVFRPQRRQQIQGSRRPQRVAVLLTGYLRPEWETYFTTAQRQFLKNLKKDGYQADVFVYTWDRLGYSGGRMSQHTVDDVLLSPRTDTQRVADVTCAAGVLVQSLPGFAEIVRNLSFKWAVDDIRWSAILRRGYAAGRSGPDVGGRRPSEPKRR